MSKTENVRQPTKTEDVRQPSKTEDVRQPSVIEDVRQPSVIDGVMSELQSRCRSVHTPPSTTSTPSTLVSSPERRRRRSLEEILATSVPPTAVSVPSTAVSVPSTAVCGTSETSQPVSAAMRAVSPPLVRNSGRRRSVEDILAAAARATSPAPRVCENTAPHGVELTEKARHKGSTLGDKTNASLADASAGMGCRGDASASSVVVEAAPCGARSVEDILEAASKMAPQQRGRQADC